MWILRESNRSFLLQGESEWGAIQMEKKIPFHRRQNIGEVHI